MTSDTSALPCLASKDEFGSAMSSGSLSVVHFFAPWAPQCQAITDVMLELSKDRELQQLDRETKFYAVEAETQPELSLSHSVMSVPTVVFFRHGRAVGRVEGAKPAEVSKLTLKLANDRDIGAPLPVAKEVPAPAAAAAAASAPAQPKESLDSRLKKLVSSAPCMLFMKGSPQQPKCGFSRQTVALLDDLKAKYSHFDILADEEVRQGLKTFSNWPTYPQLYLDGELVGGLDILKELAESGELAGMLPKVGQQSAGELAGALPKVAQQSLDERLKSLINKAPLMVFMKGHPDEPRCGFSRQLMEILKAPGIPFDTFDILGDEEVRQGLKTFSNWPTYPQVYAKGELVGGLDIIKELKEAGELESTLKGQ